MTIILVLSFLQLFFDLLFPKDVIDPLDQYSGTFIMANNKSRFLMFVFIYALFLPKREYIFNMTGKIVFLTVVGYSIYIGFSGLALLLFAISAVLAFITRSIYSVLGYSVLGLFILSSIVNYYVENDTSKDFSALEMNYHRFFHDEHGVAAVYKYGFKKLNESYYIGVGFGNFSSRSGQIFESEVTENIPKQLIKFWMPLFDTKAPYGLSSLFVLFVELGFMAIIPIIILLRWLNRLLRSSPFHIRMMIIFMFFIINYNPTFFQFNESLLYFLTLIIAYKLSKTNEKDRIHKFA